MSDEALAAALLESLRRLTVVPADARRVKISVELDSGVWMTVGRDLRDSRTARRKKVVQHPEAPPGSTPSGAAAAVAGASAQPARASSTQARRDRRKAKRAALEREAAHPAAGFGHVGAGGRVFDGGTPRDRGLPADAGRQMEQSAASGILAGRAVVHREVLLLLVYRHPTVVFVMVLRLLQQTVHGRWQTR